MRHVAILDEELPYPLNSGKRLRTFNLLRHVAPHFRITYLCHANGNPGEIPVAREAFAELGITVRVVARKVPPKRGIGFAFRLAANLASALPYSVQTHASRELRAACEQLLRDDPPQLWHCEWTPYAHTLRGLDCRHVVMAHNVESLIWQRTTEHEPHPLKRWYLKRQWRKFERFERRAFAEAALAIAVSPEDARLMRERFAAPRVAVVENGVDTEFFTPDESIPRDPATILFLGSLDWRPNLDGVRLLLDQIFPAVQKVRPDARLQLVGRNPPAWLGERCRDLPGVELHASVPDVRPFLRRAGLLAVPLRIGGGSRLKILEALASGLPVVSTAVGAEGLELTHPDHLLIADDPAPALLDALADPAGMAARTRRGRARVLEQYDWQRLGERLRQLWAAAIDGA